MESWPICTLCCSSTARDAIPPRGREGLIWRKFFRQLLEQGVGGGGKGGKRTANNKAWKVCQGCFPLINRAVQIRARCEEMEDRVNQLQLEVVKEMKRLGEGMTQFQLEMKGVEGLVRGSEKTYASIDFMRRREKALTQAQEKEASSIEFLRRRILEVVSQLQGYQGDLNVKLVSSEDEIVKPEMINPAMFVKAEVIIPDEVEVDADSLDPLGSSNGEGDHKPGQDQESGDDEHEWSGGGNEDHDDDPQVSDDGSGLSGEAPSGFGMTVDDDEADNEGAPDSLIPVGSELPSKHDLPQSSRKRKMSSDCDQDNVMDMEVEGDKSLEVKMEGKGKIHFLGDCEIPLLKEHFILRALREQEKKTESKDKTKGDGVSSTSISENDTYSLEYDSSTGKVSFGDVELIVDEEAKVVRCGASECRFKVCWPECRPFKVDLPRRLEKLERGMKDHILGYHLGGFLCPTCLPNVRTFKEKRRLQYHISRVHIPSPVDCDICGKTLRNHECMPYHKWTHMNEVERAEALKNGQKDPRMYAKKKKGTLRLPCSICGKLLICRKDLKRHEQRHSSQERDTVTCPDCGKSLLKRYEESHKSYHCPIRMDPEGSGKIKCPHCPALLAGPPSLRSHLKSFHSTEGAERSHLCSTCGKGFRWDTALKTHMKIHQEEGEGRRWKCGWGCGKDFKMKRYLIKHQGKCKMAREGETPALGDEEVVVKKVTQPGRRRRRSKRLVPAQEMVGDNEQS